MSKIKLLILLFPGIFMACCFDGFDCCNPDLSMTFVPDVLMNYFPSEEGDTVKYYSSNDTITTRIRLRTISETTYNAAGDECPDRPGEYFEYAMTIANDDELLVNSGNKSEILYLQIGDIIVSLESYDDEEVFVGDPVNTVSRIIDSMEQDGITYRNVIQTQSDTGVFQNIYLATGFGLISFDYKSDCYYIMP